MQPDSLSYLGRAIESAIEAAVYPALLALVVAVLVAVVLEHRSQTRRRLAVARQPVARPPRSRSVRASRPFEGRA